MADSGDLSAKVEISPAEFRRILSDKFRAEVQAEVWAKLRSTFTLGGAIGLGTLVAVVSFAANWLNGTVADQVKKKVEESGGVLERQISQGRTALEQQLAQNRAALEQQLAIGARDAAREAVRADITGVEEVRKRVAEGLPRQILEALRNEEVRALIARTTAERIRDPEFWREATRPVMFEQARDRTLPPAVRLFAVTELLRDTQGEGMARTALLDSARMLPDAGLQADGDEARFLRQGLGAYAAHLARPAAARSFPDNQDLLLRVAQLVDADIAPFEGLVHRFDEARAIAWLIGLARQAGPTRAAAVGALVSHPAPEAQDRVNGLLCSDGALRGDLLAGIARRTIGLDGDADGQRFRATVRCVEEEIARLRLPPVPAGCLAGGDLLAPWRLSRLSEARGAAGRRRIEALRRELETAGPDCGWKDRMPEGSSLAGAPGRWAALRVERTASRREQPLLGFSGLLPIPVDGTEPAWLRELSRGEGEMGALLHDPAARLPYLALLRERLANLPDGNPAVPEARRRIAIALLAARPAPGRPAERLALDMLANEGGRDLCLGVVAALPELPEMLANAPAAVAQAFACLREEAPEREWAPALARLVNRAVALPADAARPQLLFALVEAAGLPEGSSPTPETAVARLAAWLIDLSPDIVPTAEQTALLATLAGMDLAAVVDPFEQGPRAATLRGVLAGLTEAERAPLLGPMPYLDPGFAAALPVHPASPQEAGGRLWSVLDITAPARVAAERARGVLLLGPDGLPVALPTFSHGVETPDLAPGRYLLGRLPNAPAGLAPQPTVLEADRAGLPLRPGVTYRARLSQPRSFELPVTGGRGYVVETFALDSALDTVLALQDATGRVLAEDDDGGMQNLASRICYQPRESGTLTLQVRHFEGTPPRPASFEMRVTEVAACRGGPART